MWRNCFKVNPKISEQKNKIFDTIKITDFYFL